MSADAVLRLTAHSSYLSLLVERDALLRRVEVFESGAEARKAASKAANDAKARAIEQRRVFVAAFATAERWNDPLRRRPDAAVRQRVRERLYGQGYDVADITIECDIVATLGPSPLKK
jgi:hypothetical protein